MPQPEDRPQSIETTLCDRRVSFIAAMRANNALHHVRLPLRLTYDQNDKRKETIWHMHAVLAFIGKRMLRHETAC